MLGLWPGSITMTGPFADGRRVGADVVRAGFGFGAARVGVRFLDGRGVGRAAVVVDAVVDGAVLDCGVAGCPDDVDVQAAVSATEQIAATARALVRADRIMNPRGTCIAKSCQPGTSALAHTPVREKLGSGGVGHGRSRAVGQQQDVRADIAGLDDLERGR